MSESHAMVGELRTNFGKGAARKLRAIGQIPAVIYGHGGAPVHVTLPNHETTLLVRHKNPIIELTVGKDKHLVLVKDVQKDPVRQVIEHLDLLVVTKGETVTVNVPVHVTGTPFSGAIAVLDHAVISVEAEALHIPETISVDVTGLKEHAHVTAGDIALPADAKLHLPVETIIVSIVAAPAAHAAEVAAAE
ncbi:MAG: 50S ribosomal protein L25/general stress protein Ctc [Microbacteriaceae bacterium]